MHRQVLDNRPTYHLDPILLDQHGRLKVVPAATYASIDWTELRLWCHRHAVYGLPTTELVAFLKNLIGDRTAIEVGSGNGALGRALGIPLTDNLCQRRPDVALLYALQGQPTIAYPDDVEGLDALEAVKKYKPKVVVGSWVTQVSDGSRPGCVYGLDEEAILKRVETYIVFGSLRNHGGKMKAINRRPHKIIQEPWMWSRAQDSALFVWGKVP